MKLKEFIDKNFRKAGEAPTNKCPVCKKKFKEEEIKHLVMDLDGNYYHKNCYDKETGNDELKVRRTDNQLPD